jgi:hypothetical protein
MKVFQAGFEKFASLIRIVKSPLKQQMSYQRGNLQLSGKRLDLLREAWENTPVKLHLGIVSTTSDRRSLAAGQRKYQIPNSKLHTNYKFQALNKKPF